MLDEIQDRVQFLQSLAERLETGAKEYGNKSFDKPKEVLVEELLCEYLDIAGWAYILWRKTKNSLS